MKNVVIIQGRVLLYVSIFALFCNMVYWIFPFRPIVWRLLFLLCAVDVILLRKSSHSLFEKMIILFVFLNIIYFLLSVIYMPPDFGMVGDILVALLSLSFFSYMGDRGYLNSKFLLVALTLLLIGSVLGYYHTETSAIKASGHENVTVNASSAFLMLLPLVMLVRNDVIKIICFTVCLLFIIASAKRGNIIAAVIPTICFIILLLKGKDRKSLIRALFLIAVLIAVGGFLYNHFLTDEYLIHRVEETLEGRSSGRDVIYADAWYAWYHSDSIIHYLFGFGFDGTILHPQMKGMHAHNDWLEILVDYGLVGVVIYLMIFICFYIEIRKTKDFEFKLVMLSAFFIWLFKTAYSMGFTEAYLSLLFISVGTAMSQRKQMPDIIP